MTAVAIAAAEVTVDGDALPAEFARGLLSVRVATRLATPAQCELAYATARGPAAEHDRIRLGAAITVHVAGQDTPLFAGEVTCLTLEYAPDTGVTLRVRCYDRLHRLRKRQQPRVFTDLTAAELAGELTADLGLGVSCDDEGPVFERIVGDRRNDFALLTSVAARAGLHPVADGDELRLVTAEGYGDPVRLELGTSLWEVRAEANLDRGCTSMTALGWNPGTAEVLTGTADAPRSGRHIGLEADSTAVGVDGAVVLLEQRGRSAEEIEAVARAALDRRVQHLVTLTGVAAGDVHLRAGKRISVAGLAEAFAGEYVLTEAVHTLDATGYLTTLSTVPPPPDPEATEGAGITLGVVADVEDPEGLGRVRVSLPAHGDADAGWLGVLCPGAGSGRGLVMLPDRGDTVLVAFAHGPDAGVVLGSLYGAVEPFDPGVDGGGVRRWSLRSARGQSVTVDDAADRVTVADRAGSVLELAPGQVTLHAATDLVIQAPGRSIRVRARTVDFEHAAATEPPPAGPGPQGGA